MSNWIVFSVLLSAAPAVASAADVVSSAGTSAGTAVNVGGSARSLAMGGCGETGRGEAAAVWINPSLLARLAQPQLSFMHGMWVEGVSVEQCAVGQPTGYGSFAAGFTAIRIGSIDTYNSWGTPTGKYSPGDMAVSLAYALGARMLTFGVAGSWLKSDLAEGVGATTMAFDAGASVVPFPPLTVSVSALHMGGSLKYGSRTASLPQTVRGGASFAFGKTGLTAAVEAIKPADGIHEIRAGAEEEFTAGKGFMVAARGGWRNGAPEGSMSGLTLGGGIRWYPGKDSDESNQPGEADGEVSYLIGAIALDYAWTPLGELGNAHWFSIALIF